jgi:cell division protein FtsW
MTSHPRTATAPARPGLIAGVRTRVSRLSGPTRQQFLERPYASVQMLLLASAGLLVFGVLMAVSTTIAAAHDNGGTGSIWGQGIKEIEFVLAGIVVFFVVMRMSPRAFRVLTYPVVALSLVAMVAVLVPGIGVVINGSRRWIDVGPLQLQPSEFGKVAMLMWGADLLSRKQQLGTLTRAKHLFVPLVPGFVLTGALVMTEPDLGTTCCFVLILLGLLWMVGMPLRYFAGVVATIALAITALAVAAPYRLQRLTNFTDPFKDAKGAGYHTVEGLYALASGGLFGVGLGQGTSKYGWVPNANSDFVFAIIGEELGLIGCVAVLLLFALLAYVGMRIVRRSADPFARLACGAATIWLCGQAVINVGYVTGLLPVTGIPLPLISAGGTSLVVTFFVLGMLTSFARHETEAVAAARKAERLGRRTRLERWARIPVPKPYVAPKRRGRGAPAAARATAGRPAAARPGAPRQAPREAPRRAAPAAPARPRRVAEAWAEEPPRRRYASGGRAS